MVANPIKNYPSKDLARHREQRHPSIVVAVLAITLPFPERDNAPLPVSWDYACISKSIKLHAIPRIQHFHQP